MLKSNLITMGNPAFNSEDSQNAREMLLNSKKIIEGQINNYISQLNLKQANIQGKIYELDFDENDEKLIKENNNHWEKIKSDIPSTLYIAKEIIFPDNPIFKLIDNSQNNFARFAMALDERMSSSIFINQLINYGQLIIILLFIIVFYLQLRSLSITDNKEMKVRAEINDIMETITEGLFLLDENLNLGEQYSSVLPKIIGRDHIENINLRTLLERIVDPKEFDSVNGFIKQLFTPRIKESLIHDLNPLDKIKVNLDKTKDKDTWLSFHFNRIYTENGKKVRNVLVSVRDISKIIEAQHRLEREREQNNHQLELLTTILRVDSRLMTSFVRSAHACVNRINSILRRPHHRPIDLRQKLEDIFREAHSFKGESSAMELSSFVSIATDIEEKLKNLSKKITLNGDDFLSITVDVDSIITLLEHAESLLKRLGDVKLDNIEGLLNNINTVNQSETDIFADHLSHFADQVAVRNGKSVSVELIGFERAHFSDNVLDSVRDIVVQMIRNAIVHGIERPEMRLRKGKAELGNIVIELENDEKEHFYKISIQDDGQGINLNALKKKALTLPQFKDVAPDKIPVNDLYKIIFISGFSTAESNNEDAGRGVGMNVIRERIAALNGTIRIDSKEGSYTKFIIRFPHEKVMRKNV